MSGLELEAYIINGTIIACLIAKASKWVFEELHPVVLEYQKLRDEIRNVRQEKNIRALPDKTIVPGKGSSQISPSIETHSKDESNLAA
jgi:hypothetical protein